MLNKFKLLGFICITTIIHCPYVFAQMPTPQALFTQIGINQKDIQLINQGETVLFNVTSNIETELTAGVIIYVPATPIQVSALIKKDGLASLDPLAISGGVTPLNAFSLNTLNSFNFAQGSTEEHDFLNATPGEQFNFSPEEYQSIKAQASTQSLNASDIYRQLLWQRWQSYRHLGLKGIASYDRGNNRLINPGTDLTTAALAHDIASDYFPEVFKAWLNYPTANLPKGVEESYTWSNRLVQSRPSAILTHRFIISEPNGELILGRQFYSGHSFNVNQLTITCLPYRDGAILFYTNRNFTDQVIGFGSALKHLIGNNLAQNQVVDLLKTLQQNFKNHR